MAVHQAPIQRHVAPFGLELVGAAVMGAAIRFGALVAVGHPDLLPWARTTVNMPTVSLTSEAGRASAFEAQARAERALGVAGAAATGARAAAMHAQAEAQYREGLNGVSVTPGR